MMTTQTSSTNPFGFIAFTTMIAVSIVVFAGAFGYGIAAGMSDYAKLVVAIVATTLIITLPFLLLVIAIVSRSQKTLPIRVIDQPAPDHDEPRQSTRQIAPPRQWAVPPPQYDDYPEYMPVAPQLAYRRTPPREVHLPRYAVNGERRPIGYEPQPVDVSCNTADGQQLKVDVRLLSRLMECPTPARTEFRGDNGIYSKCTAIAIEQGLLTRQPNKSLRWADAFDDEANRLDWLRSVSE